MHGRNRVRHQQRISNQVRCYGDDILQVQSIFYTLQGEGPFAGHPAVFVRLTGCNLRCTFCDTEWDDEHDPQMTVDQIVREIYRVRGPANLVVVTGGEPLRQDLQGLFYVLRHPPRGYEPMLIQVETAGTLWQNALYSDGVTVVVSPKTPKIHPEVYHRAAAFKYVIRKGWTDPEDGLPQMDTQRLMWLGHNRQDSPRLARPRPGAPVYLSPCDETGVRDVIPTFSTDGNATLVPASTTVDNQAEVVRLALKHGYIAGVQLHKIWSVP